MPTMAEPAYYTFTDTAPTILDNYAVIRVYDIDKIPLTNLIDAFATIPDNYTLVVWCPNEKRFSVAAETKFTLLSTIYSYWDILFLTPEAAINPARRAFVDDEGIRKKLVEYEKNSHN